MTHHGAHHVEFEDATPRTNKLTKVLVFSIEPATNLGVLRVQGYPEECRKAALESGTLIQLQMSQHVRNPVEFAVAPAETRNSPVYTVFSSLHSRSSLASD